MANRLRILDVDSRPIISRYFVWVNANALTLGANTVLEAKSRNGVLAEPSKQKIV